MIVSSLLPALSIYPMYHPWHTSNSERLGQPVGTIYSDPDTGDQVAQLISYNLLESYVLPGAYLPIELCWDPLGRTEVPYTKDIPWPRQPADRPLEAREAVLRQSSGTRVPGSAHPPGGGHRDRVY